MRNKILMEAAISSNGVVHTGATKIGPFARQPLSSMGRVAFWSFLVTTIIAAAGTVALQIFANGSIALATLTGTALVATVLVATRMRWLAGLASLLGVVLLYMYFTQPFVIESLARPRTDPNGGFGHFIGVLFLFTLITLGLAATIATVLPSPQRIGRKTPRWFRLVMGALLGVVVGALFIGAVAQPPAAAALTYTNGVPTVHMSPGSFTLTTVTIAKGSKLLLVDDTSEQHVLANGIWQQSTPLQKQEPGAPKVNRLSVSGNSVTIGPFAIAGTYHIICLIHRGMTLTITVQ